MADVINLLPENLEGIVANAINAVMNTSGNKKSSSKHTVDIDINVTANDKASKELSKINQEMTKAIKNKAQLLVDKSSIKKKDIQNKDILGSKMISDEYIKWYNEAMDFYDQFSHKLDYEPKKGGPSKHDANQFIKNAYKIMAYHSDFQNDMPQQLDDLLTEMEQLYIPDKSSPDGVKLKYDTFKIGNTASVEYDKLISKAKKEFVSSNQQDFGTIVIHQDGQTQSFDKNSDIKKMIDSLLSFAQSFKDPVFHKGLQPKDLSPGETFSKGDSIGGLFLKKWFNQSSGSGYFLSPNIEDALSWSGSAESDDRKHLYVYDLADQKNLLNLNQVGLDIDDWAELSAEVNNFAAVMSGLTSRISDQQFYINESDPKYNDPEELYRSNKTTLQALNIDAQEFTSFLENEVKKYKGYIGLLGRDEIYTKQHAGEDLLNYMGYNGISMTGNTFYNDIVHGSHVGNMDFDAKWIDFTNPRAAQEIISLVYSQLYSSIADNIKMKHGTNNAFLAQNVMGREVANIAKQYTQEVFTQQARGIETSQISPEMYEPNTSAWQELRQQVQSIIQAKQELNRQTFDGDDRGIQRQISQFNQLSSIIDDTTNKLKLLEQYITGTYGKLNYTNTFFANSVNKIQNGEDIHQVISELDQAYNNYAKLAQTLTSYDTSGFNELQKEAWDSGVYQLQRYNGTDFFTQKDPMKYIAEISSYINNIIDKKEAISPITGEVFTFDSTTRAFDNMDPDFNFGDIESVVSKPFKATIQDLIQYISDHFEGSITKFAENAKDFLWDDLFVDILSNTGMYDKQTGEMLFKQINHGFTNLGGIVGKDYTIIQRPDYYEPKISSLKPQVNEAALLGANVGDIVDVIKDTKTNTMFDIQKTMPGQNIADSLQYLEATDQQVLKLIDDLRILQKTGLYIDIQGDNILYDKEQGFSLIDLANKKQDYTANTLEEVANTYLKQLDIDNGFYDDGFASKILQMSKTRVPLPSVPRIGTSKQGAMHPISKEIINSLDDYIAAFDQFTDYKLDFELADPGSKSEQYYADKANEIMSKFPEFADINEYIVDQEQMLEKFYESFASGSGYDELINEIELQKKSIVDMNLSKVAPLSFEEFKKKAALYQQKLIELNDGNTEAYSELIPLAEEIPEINNLEANANIDQLKELYQSFIKNNFLSQYTEEQISQFSELQKLYESWELDLDEIQSRVGFDIDEQTLKLSNWYKEPIPEMAEISTRNGFGGYDDMYNILKRDRIFNESSKEEPVDQTISMDQSEADSFIALESAVQSVINAINLKNEALTQESSIVQGSIPGEIELFNSLLETLTQIAQLVQNMKIDFTINGIEDISSFENLGKIADLIKTIDTNLGSDASLKSKLKDLGDAFNTFNDSINKMNPADNLSKLSDFVGNISKAGDSLSDMATILSKTSGVFDKTVYANDKNTQDRVSDILSRYKEVSSPTAVSKAAQLQFNQDNGLILDTKDVVWLSEYNAKVEQLQTDVSLLNQELNDVNSTIELTQNGFNLLRDAQERFDANTTKATETVQNQEKQFVDYSVRIAEVQDELNRIPESQQVKFSSQYDDLSNKISDSIRQLQENEISLKDFDKEVRQYFRDFERVQKGAPGDIFAEGIFGGESIEKAKSAINNYLNSNYDVVTKNLSGGSFNKDGLYSFSAQVVDIDNKVQNLKITWDSLNGTISKVSVDTGKTWSSNFTQFIAGLKKETQRLFTYWTAQYLNPYRIIGSFKQVINIVREYDDALTEMRKVSDESVSTLQQFQKESFGIADSLGTTGKTIQNSTADWLRLGESFEEAKKSAEVSNLLLNVSEFTNIDDATKSLVSASQAYKDLDKIEIVDKLNNIGNNFSVSTDQLAKGLQNAAAVLHTQGNDIDQSLALLTAGNAITQDISKTSAGIRTISLRISGTEEAKNEIQDMGEDIDDFVVRTKSKTDQIIRDYTAVASNAYKGVSVLDENGNLRDTYDILLDIAKIYKEIQSEDKANGTNRAQALVEQLAGKNRSNIAASILENPELLQQVYEASQNSAGSAIKENEKYLDSISGKMQQMQNHLEEMANIVANSDGLKIILDLVNSILTGVTKLVDAFGGLNGIIGAAGGFLLQKGGLGINKIPTSMTKLGAKLGGLFSKEFGARMSEELKENFVLLGGDIDADIGLKNIVEANGGIENMSTELQGYINKIGEARYESITLGQAISENSQIFQGFGGVISKVTSIGSTLLTTFGTMLAVTAISAAIGAGVKAISNYIHRQEIAIQKGNEAKSNIEEITKAYQEQKDVVDNFDANEYEKLQEKQSRNALSTDEYEKFVAINNQLAEIFPELISSYDEQGNAILSLGDSAETATQQLNNLLNQEQQIAQYNLNEELGIATKGMFTQIDILQDDIEKQNQIIDTFNDFNDMQSNNGLFDISVDAENSQLRAAISQAQVLYEKAITDNGGHLKQAIYGDEEWDGEKLIARHVLEPVFDESSKGNLEQALKDYNVLLEKYNIDLSGQYSEAQMKKTEDLREIAAEWNSIAPSLIGQMGLYDEFDQIGPELQQRIRDSITQIDVTKLSKDDRNLLIQDPRAFVRSAFLDPIWNAISDSEGEIDNVKKSVFDKLLSFDGTNKTNDEYKDYINNFIEQLTSDEEAQSEIRMILKFTYEDENGNEIWNVDKQSSDIYDFFGVNKQSKSSQSMIAVKDIEAMTQEQKDALQSMIQSGNISFDPMKILPTELFKRIDEYIAKQKQSNNISTDTLSDLLNNESYKESAEKSASNLSSLTGALETLRTEGSLTAEEMVNLQNSFPDLTEFTSEAIQTRAFEELDEWISKIREGMKDMSEEGKKQAQTMIQNMIDQYGDLGVEMSDIMDTYFDILGVDQSKTSGQEMSGLTQDFYSQVEELRSRLESEGLELDMHVLYTLVASDQFSGTADQILAKYKDAQINWKITLDNQDLERHIEYQQSVINREASARSLKEANGEVLTPEDYKVSTTSAKSIARMRNRELENAITARDAINDHRSSEYAVANKKVVEAEQAALEAQIEAAQAEKEEIESATNEYQNKVTQADNAVTAAQNAIDAAEAEVGEGMANQKLYAALAEAYAVRAAANLALSGKWEEIANEHPEWYEEFIGNSLSAASSAQSDTESANGYDNIDSQQKLNQLQEDATKIQRNLTVAEQNHQKVSKSTYNALIHNAKDQIKLLKEERDANKDNISVWREKQDQIDSLSDSIYEWSTTADSLIYNQASQLASTISTAMSESISETGLTDDTINALKTAFSDLDGSKFDVSDAFYSTADGVKINTEALQELTEAEFELIGAPLANEIANVQAQLDANPGDSALQQKLENLMETNAKYFAQYEEMQKALSRNAAIDLAEGTSNAGANYDENYGRVKTYKEAYEKGLTGTDDFKAWTSYLDVYGRDTLEAYEAVSGKIERYFTEDAADGLGNFLTDMEKLGYAAQDADGYWTITADDYDAAAKDMQMGSEWFMDTMNKLEDFGFIHTYVSSLNEAQLKTRDVEEQIADAVQTYSDMVARGASDEDLQKQIEHINELESQWQDLDTVTKTWGETTEENRKKEFLGLDDQLSAFEEMYKNADTDAGRDAARKAAEDYVKQFGYTLEEGKFKLSADDLVDYESRFKKGSVKNPLSAEEMGVSEENEDTYKSFVEQIQKRYGKDGDFGNLLNNIHNLSAEELKLIDHADGSWSKGESSLEQICDTLGISYENADLLIDALAGLGLIESPGVLDSLPAQFDTLDNFLANATKGSGAGYQISTDVSRLSTDELQTQLSEISTLEVQIDPDSDVYNQLQELKKQTEIQLNIKNSDQTQTQLKEWAEAGDRENIAKTFGIDVNSEEVDKYIEQINNMPSDYDLAIHIDDSQFQTLIESITGKPYQAEVEVVGKDKLTQFVSKIRTKLQNNPITQPIVQKVQQFGQKVKEQVTATVKTGDSNKQVDKVENSVEDLNKTTGTAKVSVNAKGALSNIQNVRNQLLSLNSVVATPRINVITGNATSIISQIRDSINQLRDKTVTLTTKKVTTGALGTAHSLGTTALSRAHANGTQDWTVGEDESALVNEIGQESIVRDGVWQLIPGGPHVEDLRKDDIIFNAEQTEDLIRTGKTARRGQLVAHANGTVPGMSAFATTGKNKGPGLKRSGGSGGGKSSGGNGGGKGNKGSKNSKSSKSKDKALDNFNKYIEKLFDWIEVRLDRIQRRIDNATQQAENAIGTLNQIGSISKNKNAYVNVAMNETRSLISNNQAGEQRYYKQANDVYKKATSGKTKILDAKTAQGIIKRIKDGTIDISSYDEKTRTFIKDYQTW